MVIIGLLRTMVYQGIVLIES